MFQSPLPANQSRAGYLNQPIRREPGPRDSYSHALPGWQKRTFLPRGDSVPRCLLNRTEALSLVPTIFSLLRWLI
jgi:hypothetical protein